MASDPKHRSPTTTPLYMHWFAISVYNEFLLGTCDETIAKDILKILQTDYRSHLSVKHSESLYTALLACELDR